ncbi:hypothetical protein [Bacillus thuringiensis]|uniref:hypothetical protein n=1 Tax=Bacillus thuringiensis TaxID=1428 RepID=UPI002E197064|nr:hypothetical protein [Bacillus thuringiensis]
MEDTLNWKEKLDLTIQSGLQLIPYIGGSLSTAYYGAKQEKRFKRIESFYQEFSEEINRIQLQLPPINSHNQESLIALIEELNEKIEREHTEQKRAHFKKYLYSTLSSPTKKNFDERKFFLEILANMTILECDILISLYQHSHPIQVRNINKPGTDQYAIVGAIGRLKTYGLLRSGTDSFSIGGSDNALAEKVTPSGFGLKFIKYCLT